MAQNDKNGLGRIVALSSDPTAIAPFFSTVAGDIARYAAAPVEPQQPASALFTDLEVPLGAIEQRFPKTPIIYIATSSDQESRLRTLNEGREIFVMNLEGDELTTQYFPNEVGESFFDTYGRLLEQNRRRGVTDLASMLKRVGDDAKAVRDQVLFSPRLADFHGTAEKLFEIQQRYLRSNPELLQWTDAQLKEACPGANCLVLEAPYRGGCCGRPNTPGILIDYAVSYRKLVGEQRFLEAFTAFGGGREPWYLKDRDYMRHFKGLPTKTDAKAEEKPKATDVDLVF